MLIYALENGIILYYTFFIIKINCKFNSCSKHKKNQQYALY